MTTRRKPVIRAAELADLPAAAAVLARALMVHPDGQLLGSGTTLACVPAVADEFVEVLAYATRAGYLDLATRGSRVVGVACWITHLARRRPSRMRRPRDGQCNGALAELLGRLDLFDSAFAVPSRGTHHHLAYLGTRPSVDAYTIADLLLHERGCAADRDEQALYLEAHDDTDLRRLHRCGYDYLGVSRTQTDDAQSVAMGRTTGRPSIVEPLAVPRTG